MIQKPEEQMESDERLFRQLGKLMLEEQLFKEAELNREELAVRLNTNRSDLADAVKNMRTGQPFSNLSTATGSVMPPRCWWAMLLWR